MTDTILKHMQGLQALQALQRPVKEWDDLIVYLITSNFDANTAREWQSSLKGSDPPTYKQVTEFLNHRCQVLESLVRARAPQEGNRPRGNDKRQSAHVASVMSPCEYCKGGHPVYRCQDFLKLIAEQRLKEVRRLGLCANCLRSGKHGSGACRFGACRTCGRKHNTLLHLSASHTSTISENESAVQSRKTLEGAISAHSSAHRGFGMLLSTELVYVTGQDGRKQICRVLLDSGSQANFITMACLKRLQLKSRHSNICITGINGNTSIANRIAQIRIQSRLNTFVSDLKCMVTGRITEKIPSDTLDRRTMQLPNNIKLADPQFHQSSDIDILIGAGLFWELICVGQIRASPDHPIMQKTHFGWILAGKYMESINRSNDMELRALQASITNEQLNEQLTRFWKVEENATLKSSLTADEQYCEEHFKNKVTRNACGRIQVRLPVRDDILQRIGDTRQTASKRFHNLEKRLSRDQDLREQYRQFIDEYLKLGHMKIVNIDSADSNSPTYYLPHHCVMKPNSETTKLRVVFDGSCKSSTGISLNDALITGPVVQQELTSILLRNVRFRTFRFAFTADITKMYRQILIDEDQMRLQRILWRDNDHENLQTYELTTVTYGTSSAPYLATRALNYLAELYSDRFPRGAKHISRDFYVDDLLTGADTLEDALEIRDQIIQILKQGCFQLSKLASNDGDILSGMTDTTGSFFNLDNISKSRILGILWNPSTDTFKFEVEPNVSQTRVTKREMLSEVALFDFMGLLGPIIIVPKLIIQEIWRLNLHWDESVPISIHTRWAKIRRQLVDLSELGIPRCVKNYSKVQRVQLHGFCDASERAYGACIYVRSSLSDGEARVTLLCSKSRVAPLKAVSLPRLELCAAVLLAQLMERVQLALELDAHDRILWSDSTIALSWIASCSRK